MFLRFQGLAGWNLTDIGVIGLTGALQADTGRQSPRALPRLERHFTDILDEEALDDGNAFAGHPPFIGTAFFSNRLRGNLRFLHLIFLLPRNSREPIKTAHLNHHRRLTLLPNHNRLFQRAVFSSSRSWIRQLLEKSLSFQFVHHALVDKLPEVDVSL